VLTNPKYIGANIYNRQSFKLKHKRVKNPTQMWIWRDGAFDSMITVDLFERARTIIESRHRHLSDEELLERLKELLRIQGRLSGVLINETDDMPSSGCYSSRFGSLARAYELIGWTPERETLHMSKSTADCKENTLTPSRRFLTSYWGWGQLHANEAGRSCGPQLAYYCRLDRKSRRLISGKTA
jgi:hypothetical protein